MDDEARGRHRFGDRIAEAASRVVVFDRNQHATRCAPGVDQRLCVDWLNRIGVDDVIAMPSAFS